MRGKAGRPRHGVPQAGITPAYAGKSRGGGVPPVLGRDHPRLCGEKHPELSNRRSHQGSPPPMRGKGTFSSLSRICKGITPAYAGKRPCGAPAWTQRGDHPRLCGEKALSVEIHASTTGSPPPMRGKVTVGQLTALWGRITPAYAGKSFCGFGFFGWQ